MPEDILFVCVENARRSQMAEAFFRKFASKRFSVSSAGTTPLVRLDPIVIDVMKEIGIDMTDQVPKLLTNSMIENSSTTVNMGCMDKEYCPSLSAENVIDWSIPDPKEKTIDQVRTIRDRIRSDVLNLLESLEGSAK